MRMRNPLISALADLNNAKRLLGVFPPTPHLEEARKALDDAIEALNEEIASFECSET